MSAARVAGLGAALLSVLAGLVVLPWTVELSGRQGRDWAGHCTPGVEPVPLVIPQALGEVTFADFLSLRVQIDPPLAARVPSRVREVSQAEFGELVAAIRAEARLEFGSRADSPSD